MDLVLLQQHDKIIGNRNYIGIEIDENYIELTNKRLNDIDNKE